ncbi:hypothetical protein KQ878_00205 [Mycoplasma zalophidermidis]|uniref:DED domain-containing protein n=1 Tax=Mycoplasma zalophidermidis TaxID=398174 RepID=A0ABS6DQN1_9MOLU|nr:hypothetical protein [Mycoplasma zalophidermidis]MBU4689431.1 hypothetical protein [Mycoplasma zalophidermidis]MBU4693308.1 hypothetical protein [Mycoplasma zalophidermidis]
MIKYNTIEKQIHLNKEKFASLKHNQLMFALANKIKSTPEVLKGRAIDEIMNKEVTTLIEEVNKDKTNVLVGRPFVNIIEAEEELKAEIVLVYYSGDEINKIDLNNIKFDYQPTRIDQSMLDTIFNEFKKKYPILKEVKNRPVKEGDICDVNLIAKYDGEEKDNQKNIKLQAQKSESFSINQELIGKNIGQTFAFNDPSNYNWTVTINKAFHEEIINVTEENFEPMIDENINSLEELKNEFEKNIRKEYYSNELFRYFSVCATELANSNDIEIHQFLLNDSLDRVASQEARPGGILDGLKSISELDKTNPDHLKLMDIAYKSVLSQVSSIILMQKMSNLYDLEPTQEQIQNEITFINKIDKTSRNTEINPDMIASGLKRQFAALKIIQILHPDVAKLFLDNIKCN